MRDRLTDCELKDELSVNDPLGIVASRKIQLLYLL